MKISLDFNEKEIEYIKKISIGQSIEDYLKAYLDFNLFNKINTESKDEFDKLIEEIDYYKINQNLLAEFLNTTQSTVSRFLKNKSKRSFLYEKIFTKYESTEYFIFDAYYFSRNQLFKCIFTESENIWIKNILNNNSYLENTIKCLVLDVYEAKNKELSNLYYKEIEISKSLKKSILNILDKLQNDFKKDKYIEKDIEYLYDLELKYKDELIINELF